MSETWVVVDDSGDRHEVIVERTEADGGQWWARSGTMADFSSRSAQLAVKRIAWLAQWSVAEVLAPGEPTRGEMAASLHATLLRLRDAHGLLDAVRASLGPTCSDATNVMLPGLVAELVACDAEMHREVDARGGEIRRLRAASAPQPIVWGSMPTPEAVAAHAAKRSNRIAPWMRRYSDANDDFVEVVYLNAADGRVLYRRPDGAVWYIAHGPMLTSKWRPITDDGGVAT